MVGIPAVAAGKKVAANNAAFLASARDPFVFNLQVFHFRSHSRLYCPKQLPWVVLSKTGAPQAPL